jgi:hypothetical protein
MPSLSQGFSSAGKMATRSALSPGIWLCGIIGVPCIAAAVNADFWVAVWLLVVFTILVLGVFVIFVFHSIKRPELLQSEDYLLKKDAITIYGSSSYSGPDVAQIVIEGSATSKETAMRSLGNG